jgi:adenylate kinase family enzyme
MKLMILGQENVGKTTIAKKLSSKWRSKDKIFLEMGNQNLSTDGIDIDTFYFSSEEKDEPYVLFCFIKLGFRSLIHSI